jgi:hypothetical protein
MCVCKLPQVIHLINVIYVVNYLVRMIAYRHTLEDIQVIHLINVIYVVKDFAIIQIHIRKLPF